MPDTKEMSKEDAGLVPPQQDDIVSELALKARAVFEHEPGADIESLQNLLDCLAARVVGVTFEIFQEEFDHVQRSLQKAYGYVAYFMKGDRREDVGFYLGQLHALTEITHRLRHRRVPREALELVAKSRVRERILRKTAQEKSIGAKALAKAVGVKESNLSKDCKPLVEKELLRRDRFGKRVRYSPTSLALAVLSSLSEAAPELEIARAMLPVPAPAHSLKLAPAHEVSTVESSGKVPADRDDFVSGLLELANAPGARSTVIDPLPHKIPVEVSGEPIPLGAMQTFPFSLVASPELLRGSKPRHEAGGERTTWEEKPRLALYVSERCQAKAGKGKGWFEFRRFVTAFGHLLSSYTLLVSATTAQSLAEIESDLNPSEYQPPHQPLWSLETSSNSRRLVNKLVANEKPVERILWFLDPSELEEDLRRLWTLREAAAQHDQKLYINLGARVWAERESNRRSGVGNRFSIGEDDAIVLLRQVSSPRFDRFTLKYLSKVMMFPRFVVTGRSRNSLTGFARAASQSHSLTRAGFDRMQTIENLLIGSDAHRTQRYSCHVVVCAGRGAQEQETGAYFPGQTLEGMQRLAKLLRDTYFCERATQSEDRLCHVLACPGPHPEQTDTKALEVLIRACADPHMRVNLILNEATAEEWMQPPVEQSLAASTPTRDV